MAFRRVVFGTPSNNDALTVRFGVEHGVFAAEGLDLVVHTVFGGPAIAAAFDTGEVQVGSVGSPTGIAAIAAGRRLRIVASGCRRRAHLFLGVRPGIDGYAALRGARIGVLSIGSCPSYVAHRLLSRHGLDAGSDVELVALHEAYPRVVDLVAEGRIDACIATEPNLSIGETRGVLQIWAAAYEPGCLPVFQWGVRVAGLEVIAREPELVETVLRASRAAAHLAATDVDGFVGFVARHYGTTQAAARRAVERELPLYELDGRLDLPGLDCAVEMMCGLGAIPPGSTAAAFTDLRYQADAAAQHSASGRRRASPARGSPR